VSVCETDAVSGGGAVTVAIGPEVGPADAVEAATDSGWLASGVDAITVSESDDSPIISNTVVGIDAPTTVVAVVVEIVAATMGAPIAHVAGGAEELTAVPSRTSRSTMSTELPLARGRRSSSAS